MASTGVIGVRLPMEKVRAGIAEAGRRISRHAGADAARAIMTTDTKPKEVAVEFPVGDATCVVGGMAKGAGHDRPEPGDHAGLLHDRRRGRRRALLRRALVDAVGESLNRITVDGDTSTNDCAIVLASGARPARAIDREGPDFDAFRGALTEAARQLAHMLVRDGEGVTRIAEVRVEGARTAQDADRIARTVAESPLVKTALHGGDPNWGRVLAAVGRAGRPARRRPGLDLDRRRARGGERRRARVRREDGRGRPCRRTRCGSRVRLGEGEAAGWMWTSDFSHGYVDINAHYRS